MRQIRTAAGRALVASASSFTIGILAAIDLGFFVLSGDSLVHPLIDVFGLIGAGFLLATALVALDTAAQYFERIVATLG